MNTETLFHAGQPIGRIIAEVERVSFRFLPFRNQERYRDLMAARFMNPDAVRNAVAARQEAAAA